MYNIKFYIMKMYNIQKYNLKLYNINRYKTESILHLFKIFNTFRLQEHRQENLNYFQNTRIIWTFWNVNSWITNREPLKPTVFLSLLWNILDFSGDCPKTGKTLKSIMQINWYLCLWCNLPKHLHCWYMIRNKYVYDSIVLNTV